MINAAILANPPVINHGLCINFQKNASLKCTKTDDLLGTFQIFIKLMASTSKYVNFHSHFMKKSNGLSSFLAEFLGNGVSLG